MLLGLVMNIKNMLINFTRSVSLIFGLLLFSSATYAINEAELILSSNHVLLMTGERQSQALSVAITDQRIVWIGDHQTAKTIKGKHINFGDQAILPGFIDAHGHASYVAFATQVANLASPPVGEVKTIADLQLQLKNFIKEKEIGPGEWVIGLGYDDSLLKEQRHPTKKDLDAVSTSNPIYLIHVSSHLGAANSLALSLADITKDSLDPSGGKIRRLSGSTKPNGVFEETAAYPLQQLAMTSYKDPLGSVREAMKIYARNGITTAQDGAASLESIALMQAAAAQGYLNLDVITYPIGQGNTEALIDSFAFGQYQGRLKLGGIKLVLDGSPQGKTAYLTQPYLRPPHGQVADYKGYPLIPQTSVNDLVKTYSQAGIPIMAHANGDAAADMLIQSIEEAGITSDHRTIMIHAQTVREDQLDQMKVLGIIPSYFSSHTFYWGDWHRDSVFGIQRASRISPTRSTLERDMLFTVHNDAPIVPPDMIRLLWSTTNRLTRSGKVLGEDQKISTYNALKAMTINAAYQHFEEKDKGTIEVGKLADLVVLSVDPLSIQIESLLDIKIISTFSHGKEIFSSSQ